MSEEIEFLSSTATSTRVRLARNVYGYPFSNKLNLIKAKEIVDMVSYGLKHIDNYTQYDIGKLSSEEANLLLGKHLISRDLIKRKNISAAFITKDEQVSVMVNEEDHLREQCILPGFNLINAYQRLKEMDDKLERFIDFSYDDKLGYLTACPSNLGTGMRASVMMFLPGLTAYKKLGELLPSLKNNGLTVRGVFGEGTAAEGYSYQISNERTLGVSETEILSHMNEVALNLAELETRAREKMIDDDEIGYKDVTMRAYGMLTNCAILKVKEFMDEIVKVRLGAALGFLKINDMLSFNEFIELMHPTTFKIMNCPEVKNEKEADIIRADIVHRVLPEIVSYK